MKKIYKCLTIFFTFFCILLISINIVSALDTDVNNYYGDNYLSGINISDDIENYLSNHTLKVSFTQEQLDTAVERIKNLIYNYNINLTYNLENFNEYDEDDNAKKYSAKQIIYQDVSEKIIDNTANKNIVAGYVYDKVIIDNSFNECDDDFETCSQFYNMIDDNTYYETVKSQVSENSAILDNSRYAKERIEKLILLYSVSNDEKYLKALKIELLDDVSDNWDSEWNASSSNFIATAEIAYTASLAYDFLCNSTNIDTNNKLSLEEKIIIENRLLETLVLYGKSTSTSTKSNGNFNQVINSSMSIVSIVLLDSINDFGGEEALIKVNSKKVNGDSFVFRFQYPIKSIDDDNDNEIEISYPDNDPDTGNIKITDKEIANFLNQVYTGTNEDNKTIPLKSFYAAIIKKSVNDLSRIFDLKYVSIDGVYGEGKNYYLYGMKYFSYYLATLKNTLNTDYNMLSVNKNNNDEVDILTNEALFNNIVLYPIYNESQINKNYNYGDSSSEPTEEDSLFYLANLNAEMTGQNDIAKVVYDYKRNDYTRNRKDSWWEFYSIIWYKEDYDKVVLSYDKVFEKYILKNEIVQNNLNNVLVANFRQNSSNQDSIFVGFKGGNLINEHQHLDLGSFVFDALGIRWIDDPGAGPYGSKNYHNETKYRWLYYKARAEAHSTIVINKPILNEHNSNDKYIPADQWRGAKATFEKIDTSDNTSMAVLNLTDAYNKEDNNDITSSIKDNIVKRGIKLFDSKKYLLVQDEVDLYGVSDYYSFINVNKNINQNNIVISDDNNNQCATITYNDKKLILYLVSSDNNFVLKKINDITGGSGVLNDFIINGSNSNVKLAVNNNDINHSRIAVYYHSENSTNLNAKYQIYIIPVYKAGLTCDNISEYFSNSLIQLSEWYIPEKPVISMDGNIIKLELSNQFNNNETIKYSLDSGENWYEYNENDQEDINRRTISDDITILAKTCNNEFESNIEKYSINPKVTYICDNCDNNQSSYEQNIITQNTAFSLNSNSFTKTGYIFTGWNTEANGSGDEYSNNYFFDNGIQENLILYAQWEPIKYYLRFNSNGGTGEMSNQEYSYDESKTITKNTFIKDNYVFIGWNTEVNGSGTSYTDENLISNLTTTDSEIIDLYAMWEEDIPYETTYYDVDEVHKYISNIEVNTDLTTFESHFDLGTGYYIDVDTKNVDNKNVLYTGGKTRIMKGQNVIIEFTNIVLGDTNGDGKLSYLDYVNVYNHIQKVKHPESSKLLLENEYYMAGDMSKDNNITYIDYVKIYQKIKQLKNQL